MDKYIFEFLLNKKGQESDIGETPLFKIVISAIIILIIFGLVSYFIITRLLYVPFPKK